MKLTVLSTIAQKRPRRREGKADGGSFLYVTSGKKAKSKAEPGSKLSYKEKDAIEETKERGGTGFGSGVRKEGATTFHRMSNIMA